MRRRYDSARVENALIAKAANMEKVLSVLVIFLSIVTLIILSLTVSLLSPNIPVVTNAIKGRLLLTLFVMTALYLNSGGSIFVFSYIVLNKSFAILAFAAVAFLVGFSIVAQQNSRVWLYAYETNAAPICDASGRNCRYLGELIEQDSLDTCNKYIGSAGLLCVAGYFSTKECEAVVFYLPVNSKIMLLKWK